MIHRRVVKNKQFRLEMLPGYSLPFSSFSEGGCRMDEDDLLCRFIVSLIIFTAPFIYH